MASTATTQIDRQRIEELTGRELARLNDRTPGSQTMYERARQTLSGGVASSYQVRDPWPIYLSHGKGPRVWDVDGNVMLDFHNGFGSMVQGHAHPAISKAVAGARRARHALRGADRGRRRRLRGARPPLRPARNGATSTPAPRRRWTRSASRGRDTGRDTIVKIFGSYHGHHDYVMVSIGVPYDRIGDRENLASLPYGGGIPQAVADMTIPVPFNDARRDGAPDRAPDRGGPQACLRDHGGGDDEPRRRPAGAGVPRGRPRAHARSTASC